jgi:hypothetical protein
MMRIAAERGYNYSLPFGTQQMGIFSFGNRKLEACVKY